MSGWNAYVDTQLVATGAVCQAGIFGKADMQCYANAGDFQVGVCGHSKERGGERTWAAKKKTL